MRVVLQGQCESQREIFRGKKTENVLIKRIKKLILKRRKKNI